MQELKGNIRVFCRVRPVAEDKPDVEVADGQPIVQFPGTGQYSEHSVLYVCMCAYELYRCIQL